MSRPKKAKPKTSTARPYTYVSCKLPADEAWKIDGIPHTIPEHCMRNRYSIPMYYKEKKADRGPRETRIGTVVTITPEAEAEWREQRTDPAKKADELVQA